MSEPPGGSAPRAMVLAAGLGTRLRPATDAVPKPLLPILGRPLLQEVCLALVAAGCGPLAINTHHLAPAVAAWARRWRGPGPAPTLLHEREILGTGGALWNAREFLGASDDFVLHNGDVLTDLDLLSLVGRHRRCGAVVTMGLASYPPIDSVLLGPDGAVRDVGGRLGAVAGPGDRRLTYTGVAAISRELLERLPPGPSSLVDALLALLRERPGSVRGWQPPRLYWNDLGTPERYLQAHADLLRGRRLRPTGMVMPAGPVFRARGSRVARDAKLEDFVSIGAGSEVGPGARLRACVVLPGGKVAAGEALAGTIVGDGWRLAAAAAPALAGSVRERAEAGADSAAAPALRPAARAAVESALHLPLLRRAGFGPRTRAWPLPGGSDRCFWRLRDDERSAVLVEADARDPEFGRWLAIGRWLEAEGLGGPAIVAEDLAGGAALMEDLGDLSFELLVGEGCDTREGLGELYERGLARLVDLQVRGTAALARCPAAGERRFGYEDLRWETGYFRQRFLAAAAGVPGPTLARLEEDFHRLALAVLEQPAVLMHRDFQSRNLLMYRLEARIVDFGGMQRGPLGYDLASLLRDPYADLPDGFAEDLREVYRLRLAAAGGPALTAPEMERLEVLAGLQRLMQAVGAFAHLGLVRGKREFLRHIPSGLARLTELLAEWRGLRGRWRRGGPEPDLGLVAELVLELRRRDPEAWRRGQVR